MNKIILFLLVFLSGTTISFASTDNAIEPDIAYRSLIYALINNDTDTVQSLMHPECKIELENIFSGFEKYFKKKWQVNVHDTDINDYSFYIISETKKKTKVTFTYTGDECRDAADFVHVGDKWYLKDI